MFFSRYEDGVSIVVFVRLAEDTRGFSYLGKTYAAFECENDVQQG